MLDSTRRGTGRLRQRGGDSGKTPEKDLGEQPDPEPARHQNQPQAEHWIHRRPLQSHGRLQLQPLPGGLANPHQRLRQHPPVQPLRNVRRHLLRHGIQRLHLHDFPGAKGPAESLLVPGVVGRGGGDGDRQAETETHGETAENGHRRTGSGAVSVGFGQWQRAVEWKFPRIWRVPVVHTGGHSRAVRFAGAKTGEKSAA